MKTTVRQLIKITMPAIAMACLFIFPPWNIVWAQLSPFPDSIQELVDDAIDHGLDGKIERTTYQPIRMYYSRLPVLARCI